MKTRVGELEGALEVHKGKLREAEGAARKMETEAVGKLSRRQG